MRKSVALYSSSELVAKRHRFPEASRSIPQVLAARGETSSLRSQFVTLKTGRVRNLEVCT
jgi:hypothetical protein